MNPPNFPGQGAYKIVVQGHLDEQSCYWFEGMTLTTGFDEGGAPITTLAGRFVDQAALHGVLATIRDLNLPLISVFPASDVTPIAPNSQDASQA
jgi:hypothetical protein